MSKYRPDKVRVGVSDFRVLWKGHEWFRSSDCFAQFDPVQHTITLYDDGDEQLAAARFAHEVAHAMSWYHCLYPKDSPTLTDEQCADLVGYQMSQFWQANPGAFGWYYRALTRWNRQYVNKAPEEDELCG